MLQPGQILERHVVDRVLGVGGMAVVYLVHHAQLGTPAALKVLTLTRQQVRDRFVQEGRVQATLRHPNIVSVFDLFEIEGSPALLMEYIDGPALSERLADGPLPPAVAEEIFRGIVAGVAEAHRLGLVHRDLKPANVLLATIDGVTVPKVADFGLVKLTEGERDSVTRSGMTMGTPAYMAPEQIRDAKRVDLRADVFSLGCILYEMVTGRPPFAGDDVLEIMTAVTSGEHAPPESIVPELPSRFGAAIAGCLEVDPERRIASCGALLRVLSGESATATPPPVVARPPASGSWRVAAIGAGLAALAAGAILFVVIGTIAIGSLSGAAADAVIGDDGPCGGRPGEIVGWANHRGFFFKRKGSTWTVPSDRKIYAWMPEADDDAALPGDSDVVCVLPKGTKVDLEAPAIGLGGTGTWIPITAGAYTLPSDTDAPDGGSPR